MNAAREQLSFFSEKQIQILNPQAGVPLGEEAQMLKRDFFARLTAIFLFHPGEPVLIVRKRIVAGGYGVAMLQKHLYCGIISREAKVAFADSGEALLPTDRYVDSPDYLPKIDHLKHTGGGIPEVALGGNILWQFYQRVMNDYGLSFFIGIDEVKVWFRNKRGYYPYMHPTFSRALGYTLPVNDAPPLQLAASA